MFTQFFHHYTDNIFVENSVIFSNSFLDTCMMLCCLSETFIIHFILELSVILVFLPVFKIPQFFPLFLLVFSPAALTLDLVSEKL